MHETGAAAGACTSRAAGKRSVAQLLTAEGVGNIELHSSAKSQFDFDFLA
jgi:hypothetical protein